MSTFIPNYNNLNTRHLTPDQQRLISMYINQYNQTNTHIDILLDMLDEIRGNIINIINSSQPRRNRIHRHSRNSNLNINRILNQIFNDRQNNFVYYDFENPINPNIYNNFNDLQNNYHLRTNSIQSSDLDAFLTNFLNNTVVIRPTDEQIQNASRLIRYGSIENPLSETCPISLEEFNDNDEVRQLLPCGHIFHQNQFQEWFQTNVRCPVCRYDIRNYRSLSRRNNSTSANNNINAETSSNTGTNNIDTNSNNNNNSTSDNNNNIDTNNLQNNHQNTTNNNNNINDSLNRLSEQDTSFSNIISNSDYTRDHQDLTNNLVNRFARNIFQSLLNSNSLNSDDRFMIDPSNNILFYETIIRPRGNRNSNQNEDNT